MKIGFIGCGNMGGALASAAIKTLGSENVLVVGKSVESTRTRAENIGATPSTVKEIAENCRLIFLGVKPNIIAEVSGSLRPFLSRRSDDYAVVSMAAGVTIASLSEMLGECTNIIRMMPNTSVAVGEGMIVYSYRASESDIEAFENSMSQSGMVSKIPEELVDAATAVMGCGPAFAYRFAEAIADGGVACGLTRKDAETFTAQMLLGAAKMMLSSNKAPSELREAVCSKGGSTIEGVRTLDEKGFPAAVVDAVKASYEKTKKLGEK